MLQTMKSQHTCPEIDGFEFSVRYNAGCGINEKAVYIPPPFTPGSHNHPTLNYRPFFLFFPFSSLSTTTSLSCYMEENDPYRAARRGNAQCLLIRTLYDI